MATGIPRDLISQIRISLRREANLSSYDPGNVSLSSLPSTADVIAELDPSPPYLRCKHCKGRLMRGIDSLICVFCGKQQRTSDNPPDNIKFTSTAGYAWLLDSLHLNGSEMVETTEEADGTNRRKSPIEVIPLSKLLDLEIQWRPEEENSTTSSSHKTPVQDQVPLNLGGLDLDSFFIQEKQAAPDVQPRQNQPNDNSVYDDFSDPRTLSLFENVDATGSNQLQHPENFGFFDKQVGIENVSSERQGNINMSVGKDTQENQFSLEKENLSLFEGNSEQKSSSAAEEAGHLSLFQSLEPSVKKSLEDKIGDSSDWEVGFQSAGKQTIPAELNSIDPFMGSPAELSTNTDPLFEPGKDLFGAKPSDCAMDPGSNAAEWFQGDFISSATQEEHQNSLNANNNDAPKRMDANGTSSNNIDWNQDDIWQTSTSIVPNNKTTNYNDAECNEFATPGYSKSPDSSFSQSGLGTLDETTNAKTGGIAERGAISQPSMNWDEVELWQIGSTSVPAKTQDQTNDPFDSWSDFTGSNVSQVPSVSYTQHSVDTAEPSVQQILDIDLLGAANGQKDFDFSGLSKPGLFSGDLSNQKSSASNISGSDRAVGAVGEDRMSHNNTTTNDLLSPTSKAKTDTDVGKLLSQMHDLSFMLEDKLSVPSNPKK